MSTGDSIIRVSIIGDVKKLLGALGQADKATGGLLKSTTASIGATLVAFGAVRKGTEFIQDSLQEADRLGDAMQRLSITVGPEFTGHLKDTADEFSKIGASTQDMLELEAVFADFGTAVGISKTQLTDFAERAAATATAMALLDDNGRDASAIMDLITKAAGGSAKAAKELGVNLIDTKDPVVQMSNVLSQLNPKLLAATQGTGDLEQKQKELGARIETLQAQLGQELSPALEAVLGFIVAIVEDIPQLITNFEDLGKGIEDFARNVLGPLGNVRDVLEQIVKFSTGASGPSGRLPGVSAPLGGGLSDSGVLGANNRNADRNGFGKAKVGDP